MQEGYSICFNIWALDNDIKNELRLLLIISSLCAEKGYCYASNKYFADLFHETEVSISNKIKKLESKGYIKIEYERRGCEVTARYLRLKNFLIDGYKNFYSTIKKNFKENNTSINNTSINIYKYIVEYLNEKAKTNYKHTTAKTQSLIKARLNEGFTKEDFIQVIDNKIKEWLNTDMQKYLRPETLFGTKFESYLNQRSITSNKWFKIDEPITIDKTNDDEQKELEELLKEFKK